MLVVLLTKSLTSAIILVSLWHKPSLSSHHETKTEMATLIELFEKQKTKIPLQVQEGIYLTNVEMDTQRRQVFRTYYLPSLDFARSRATQAKQFTLEIGRELFEQCLDHNEQIFELKISFHYRFIDKSNRVIGLNVINAERCAPYVAARNNT